MIELDRPHRSGGFFFRLVGAWALVGVPIGWGVWQVIKRSLDLFR